MRGSKYLNLNWDLDPQKDCWIRKCRIRRKKWQIPTGKEPEPGIVEPWPALTGGSKNLNCRRIFGFAKKIVGSESVGSAANVTDPEGKRLMRIRTERGLLVAEEKDLLVHQKVVCGSEFFTFG